MKISMTVEFDEKTLAAAMLPNGGKIVALNVDETKRRRPVRVSKTPTKKESLSTGTKRKKITSAKA